MNLLMTLAHVLVSQCSGFTFNNVINVKLSNMYFVGYIDLGDASETYAYCQVAMRYQERTRKNRNQANAKYSLCCSMGRIQLPFLKNPAMLLQQLLCLHSARLGPR